MNNQIMKKLLSIEALVKRLLEKSDPETAKLIDENKKQKDELFKLREELQDVKKKNATLKGEVTKLNNKYKEKFNKNKK